jgi:hypothetical protein
MRYGDLIVKIESNPLNYLKLSQEFFSQPRQWRILRAFRAAAAA